MNKQIEVIYNLLPLLTTIGEGFKKLKKQLTELRYEEAFILLQDTLQGIISIERALIPIEHKLTQFQLSHMKQTENELCQYLNEIVILYEERKYLEMDKIMDYVMNAYVIWSKSIRAIVIPNIVL